MAQRGGSRPSSRHCAQLSAGLFQHPAAHRNDQPALLGELDELVRRQQPALGMLPADQRFHAADQPRAQLELGLVVEARVRRAASAWRRSPSSAKCCAARSASCGVKNWKLFLPRALAWYMAVSADLSRLAASAPSAGIDADAHAAADLHVALAHPHRLAQHVEHPAGHLGQRRRVGAAIDQHHELVAAQARHHVGATQQAAQPSGHDLEQVVAGIVTEGVVDALEAVQVDEQHRKAAVAGPGAGQNPVQLLQEHASIGQPGEAVEPRQLQHLLFGQCGFGDVAADAAVALELAGVEDGLATDADVKGPPVRQADAVGEVTKRLVVSEPLLEKSGSLSATGGSSRTPRLDPIIASTSTPIEVTCGEM